MARNWRAQVCVGAAIFRGDRLLLLRRSSSVPFPMLWEIPGGHVEVGESLEVALRREVREETGLRVKVGRPFYAWSFNYPRKGTRRVGTVEVDFHCSAPSKVTPVLDPKEHTDFAWVGRQEMAGYPTDHRIARIYHLAFSTRE